uniref:Universal stress protein n=1 Tax=Staphylothermus marinus TaxID=2280 RepID=A0A7C4D9P7_STAMA
MSYREAPTYEISFMYRKILVPIDGSENSLKALDIAIDLAKHYGSRITVVYAKPKDSIESRDLFDKVKKRVEKRGVDIAFKIIEYDSNTSSVANSILNELIEGGYDLVIMGARGLTLTSELNIGSTALSLVINSPVTIMVVR